MYRRMDRQACSANRLAWRGVEAVRRVTRRFTRLTGLTQAQTIMEYALLSGFVAVVGAMSLMQAPTTTDNLKKLLNKLGKYLAMAAGASAQSFC